MTPRNFILPGGFSLEEAKQLHADLVTAHTCKAITSERMKTEDRARDLGFVKDAVVSAAWFVQSHVNEAVSLDPARWVPVTEQMPNPASECRVCAYTPTDIVDLQYRFVPASLFKAVCSEATHWFYMQPPTTEE
jgi:hypothetical protein